MSYSQGQISRQLDYLANADGTPILKRYLPDNYFKIQPNPTYDRNSLIGQVVSSSTSLLPQTPLISTNPISWAIPEWQRNPLPLRFHDLVVPSARRDMINRAKQSLDFADPALAEFGNRLLESVGGVIRYSMSDDKMQILRINPRSAVSRRSRVYVACINNLLNYYPHGNLASNIAGLEYETWNVAGFLGILNRWEIEFNARNRGENVSPSIYSSRLSHLESDFITDAPSVETVSQFYDVVEAYLPTLAEGVQRKEGPFPISRTNAFILLQLIPVALGHRPDQATRYTFDTAMLLGYARSGTWPSRDTIHKLQRANKVSVNIPVPQQQAGGNVNSSAGPKTPGVWDRPTGTGFVLEEPIFTPYRDDIKEYDSELSEEDFGVADSISPEDGGISQHVGGFDGSDNVPSGSSNFDAYFVSQLEKHVRDNRDYDAEVWFHKALFTEEMKATLARDIKRLGQNYQNNKIWRFIPNYIQSHRTEYWKQRAEETGIPHKLVSDMVSMHAKTKTVLINDSQLVGQWREAIIHLVGDTVKEERQFSFWRRYLQTYAVITIKYGVDVAKGEELLKSIEDLMNRIEDAYKAYRGSIYDTEEVEHNVKAALEDLQQREEDILAEQKALEEIEEEKLRPKDMRKVEEEWKKEELAEKIEELGFEYEEPENGSFIAYVMKHFNADPVTLRDRYRNKLDPNIDWNNGVFVRGGVTGDALGALLRALKETLPENIPKSTVVADMIPKYYEALEGKKKELKKYTTTKGWGVLSDALTPWMRNMSHLMVVYHYDNIDAEKMKQMDVTSMRANVTIFHAYRQLRLIMQHVDKMLNEEKSANAIRKFLNEYGELLGKISPDVDVNRYSWNAVTQGTIDVNVVEENDLIRDFATLVVLANRKMLHALTGLPYYKIPLVDHGVDMFLLPEPEKDYMEDEVKRDENVHFEAPPDAMELDVTNMTPWNPMDMDTNKRKRGESSQDHSKKRKFNRDMNLD